MKYLIALFSSIILFSCSVKKTEKKSVEAQSNNKFKEINSKSTLTEDELTIINDFLFTQLSSEKYNYYRKMEIILFEDAGNQTTPLADYDFNLVNKKSWGNRINIWILDSLQVEELKNKYKNEAKYKWKSSDIQNFKVTIMKSETIQNNIKSGTYIEMPEKLLLRISIPLLIDKNNAFISFSSGNSRVGYTTIERFTVLMKKVNGKWVKDTYYFDGNIE